MGMFAALEASQEETAICVGGLTGELVTEAKVPTCPDAIADWLAERAADLERVGMETGPLAVWLWNSLTVRHVPIVCIDARHASGVLKTMPNKTDRHDARGLVQIVRTGWFKAVQIKSHDAYVNWAILTAREALVGMGVRLENEIRGLLKTFGVMFGKRVGGFKRRAEEIIEGELAVAPELVPIFEAIMQARRDILARIAALDGRIRAIAKRNATVRLLMTAPGVGSITAMAVVAIFDDAFRFPPVVQRRLLSRADAEAVRVRRDQPERADLQARGRVHQEVPVRGGERDLLPKPWRSSPARLGPGNCGANWPPQGQGRAGPEARGHPARHVAHKPPSGRQRWHKIWLLDDADLQRDGMRPAGTRGEGEIAPRYAAKTAHTTSIHPTLNANVRRPKRRPRREPKSPARRMKAERSGLTKATRERPGTPSSTVLGYSV